MIEIRAVETGVVIGVKAVPGASRDRFAGEWNGRAKIAVAAPPEGGRANQAIRALLASMLGVRERDVDILKGLTSPLKTVHVSGVSPETAHARLNAPSP